ncbi:MAG: hypothetical protein KC420_03445 [Myxococcales bacterium]|nr:hypothetical protein [Myxococcales bacterium]
MKVSEFNLLCPSFVDGVYLAYNTLSGAFLTLDAADFELTALILEAVAAGDPITGFEPRLVVALRRGGFLVNAAVDERAEVRRRYREGRARTRGVSLTIAPTLSCNFACTYCFQEHPKRHMGEAEIDRIVRHVEANLEPETALSITWFGGADGLPGDQGALDPPPRALRGDRRVVLALDDHQRLAPRRRADRRPGRARRLPLPPGHPRRAARGP